MDDIEEDSDTWWKANKKTFESHKMNFSGQTCITAKGPEGMDAVKWGRIFQEMYNESTSKVKQLLEVEGEDRGWGAPRDSQFLIMIKRLWNVMAKGVRLPLAEYHPWLLEALAKHGVSREEAMKFLNFT